MSFDNLYRKQRKSGHFQGIKNKHQYDVWPPPPSSWPKLPILQLQIHSCQVSWNVQDSPGIWCSVSRMYGLSKIYQRDFLWVIMQLWIVYSCFMSSKAQALVILSLLTIILPLSCVVEPIKPFDHTHIFVKLDKNTYGSGRGRGWGLFSSTMSWW